MVHSLKLIVINNIMFKKKKVQEKQNNELGGTSLNYIRCEILNILASRV